MLRAVLPCLVVALAAALPAGAKRIVVKAGLAPGRLTVAAVPAAVPAGGQRSLLVRVTDARGSGRGWTLRLVRGSGLTVTSITARCAPGSTCTLPRAVGAPRAAVVLRAATGTGMGSIDLTIGLRAAAAGPIVFSIG